jgi:hypothetical protein
VLFNVQKCPGFNGGSLSHIAQLFPGSSTIWRLHDPVSSGDRLQCRQRCLPPEALDASEPGLPEQLDMMLDAANLVEKQVVVEKRLAWFQGFGDTAVACGDRAQVAQVVDDDRRTGEVEWPTDTAGPSGVG